MTSEDLKNMWPFGETEWEFNVKAHESGEAMPLVCYRPDGKPREWAFDWALPEHKIAVELDGYTYHTSRAGWLKDMQKFNVAHLQGWRVFHITPDDFRSGKADLLMQLILEHLVYERNMGGHDVVSVAGGTDLKVF